MKVSVRRDSGLVGSACLRVRVHRLEFVAWRWGAMLFVPEASQ